MTLPLRKSSAGAASAEKCGSEKRTVENCLEMGSYLSEFWEDLGHLHGKSRANSNMYIYVLYTTFTHLITIEYIYIYRDIPRLMHK